MRDDALLDALGREEIQRAIGAAIMDEEEGWCYYLDAELSENTDDPGWAAEELFEWRQTKLRKAGAFLVAFVEAEFQMTHPTEEYAGRMITLELALVLEREDSGWSVPVCEAVPMDALWSRFPAALAYAVEHHDGRTKKGTAIPYVSHALAVAASAMEMQPRSAAEAIGALLHDVVEDAGGLERAREIAGAFGFDVLRIVLSNSDTAVEPKPAWRGRKEAYLAAMADKEPDELRVSLADKLHNARSILQDHRTDGEKIWTRFNAGRDEVLWYYRQLADAFLARSDTLGPAGAATAAELDRVVSAMEDRTEAGTELPRRRTRR